jgi:predicted nuclease with TOPRIM domain
MEKVSELFEVDIEELQGYLQALDYGAIEFREILKSNNYLETEISAEIHHLRDLMTIIKSIYEIIETKAERYRASNRAIHEFLRELEDYLKKLEMLIFGKIWYDYHHNPNYIEGGLYVDLHAVSSYVKEIENLLKSAIRRGIFM